MAKFCAESITGDQGKMHAALFRLIDQRSSCRKRSFFSPGRVTFRKGLLGYLLQDPTDQARAIKYNPSLHDKSAPIKEELVRQNALNVVRQRGGDASDQKEDFGEYILQFGKYKGKSFRWLLENDVGYTIYLIKNLQQEEATMTERHSKSSLVSFVKYTHSFEEIQSLLSYVCKTPAAPAASSEDDQLLDFSARAKKMDEDAELESAMLNITPSKLLVQSPAPQLPGYDHDIHQWKCSHQQRIWMKTELESMGLWPGSPPVSNPMKTVSLWRLPPQPELIDTVSDLPKVFSIYREHGMEKEMTWKEFQKSQFYNMERQRWVSEKSK
ncbi:hypothetical protein IRJ41_024252 [Triplophysa rosa]|uniref:Uncharacterized protein n=1 Tax=Triplophysa rosa TaxID=992332 RepID=A0A9W7TJ57_TRIRA|nr:hypothetical protein IRJ41_024252 [Triplophysa rosa]